MQGYTDISADQRVDYNIALSGFPHDSGNSYESKLNPCFIPLFEQVKLHGSQVESETEYN